MKTFSFITNGTYCYAPGEIELRSSALKSTNAANVPAPRLAKKRAGIDEREREV